MNKQNLINCFDKAITEAKYVAVKVQIGEHKEPEIIINSYSNILSKLDYYCEAYDNDLVLKANNNIRITGFTYGNTFEEIEKDLLG